MVQTQRKYKTKSKMEVTTKNSRTMKEANKIPKTKLMKETARIQDVIKDSNVSFQSDLDDDMDTAEVEEEEWIEYIKRSTRDAEENMRTANVPGWIEAQRKMK